MKTLADIRREHPEYDDLDDEQLARGLHQRFYSDIPYSEFAQAVGAQRPRPRQMRQTEDRLNDPNIGVRRQAQAEVARRPSSEIPARQELVEDSNPGNQNSPAAWGAVRNFGDQVGNWLTGNVGRDEGVGEIGWQPVPERDDVHWRGGVLSPALNALPRPVRAWLDAEGRSAAIGAGMFLDPNEEHRAQIIRRQSPGAQFRRDQWGQLQVRYSPETPWAYINRPGASPEDAQTFANETAKFLATRRIVPGGRLPSAAGGGVGATSPLLTGTAREVVAGATSMAAGQTAAAPLGGPGADLGDVTMAGVGAGAGNLAAAGIGAGARAVAATPEATRRVVQWIADRLPGGATRAAERAAQAQQLLQGMDELARRHAEATVRASAAQLNLAGEALERAVHDAQEAASARVLQQAEGGAGYIDRLAQTFGVRLAKAQTEGDIEGMRFVYEATSGVHGRTAQQAANAFLADQNAALPQGLRAITPNPLGVQTPQDAVRVARGGLERAYETARGEENAAWRGFEDHANAHLRTFDVTPGGRASGVSRVASAIDEILTENSVYIRPRGPRGGPPSEAAANYARDEAQNFPLVTRLLSYVDNLAAATKEDIPVPDVRRVLMIRRRIDDLYEQAGRGANPNPAEQRLLAIMGARVRDWLRTDASGLATRAPQTASLLQRADALSRNAARIFRENRIIRGILQHMDQPGGGRDLRLSDDQITDQLFGGADAGIRVSGESLEALRAIREALGATSPEWQTLRHAAILRLTRGLDDGVIDAATGRPTLNQTPAIISTYRRIDEAFRGNREALELLFSPQEMQRLSEARRVLAAMAPTPRNPANPTNSGIQAQRAINGALQQLAQLMRNIPVASYVVRAGDQAVGAARANIETAGAPSEAFRLTRALADLWNVNRTMSAAGGSVGATIENTRTRESTATHVQQPSMYANANPTQISAALIARGMPPSDVRAVLAAIRDGAPDEEVQSLIEQSTPGSIRTQERRTLEPGTIR